VEVVEVKGEQCDDQMMSQKYFCSTDAEIEIDETPSDATA